MSATTSQNRIWIDEVDDSFEELSPVCPLSCGAVPFEWYTKMSLRVRVQVFREETRSGCTGQYGSRLTLHAGRTRPASLELRGAPLSRPTIECCFTSSMTSKRSSEIGDVVKGVDSKK